MDPILKAKWIADLRSGEFTQADSVLEDATDTKCRCCLGVLLHSAGVTLEQDVPNPDPELDCTTFAEGDELSPNALNYLDLPPKLHSDCIRRNDGSGFGKSDQYYTGPRQTFLEIADWLESEDF